MAYSNICKPYAVSASYVQSLRTAYLLALRTTHLQALRSSVFAGCSPCVVFTRRIYIVRHICRPFSSYLQALCIIFASLMQHICRPCAAYLQAAPYSQPLLCIRVVGPVAYVQAQALCIILAGPVPVQHMHTLCSILQPTVHHICIYLAGVVASASYLRGGRRAPDEA